MNKAFAALFVFALLALLLSGCVQSKPAQRESNGLNQAEEPEGNLPPAQDVPDENQDLSDVEISLSISTDKNEYGSHEEARITVVAIASKNIEGLTVKIWGITPYSKNYVESKKIVDLNEGENTIDFVETTPYCTAGCGGVYAGSYDLYGSIEYFGKELARAETKITLKNH